MVLLGFAFIIFGGIYFMFWASFKMLSWLPYLLMIAGICMVLEFILDHWIITLIIYTVLALVAFYAVSDDEQE